jgi:uroporphyrinogen decarboxylase
MDRRQAFAATLDHQHPERILVDYGKHIGSFHINAYQAIKSHFGVQSEMVILDRMAQNVKLDEAVCEGLGIDFRWIVPHWVGVRNVQIDGQPGYIDMWQTPHKWTDVGQYYAIHASPFDQDELTIEAIENFDWPDPRNPAMFSGLREQAISWYENTNYVIGADGIKVGILQTASQLRGYDKLFMDFALNPDATHHFLDKLSSIINEMYRQYMEVVGPYIQLVVITDDQGTQNSLMISPKMFREFIKPRLGSLIQTIKDSAPVKVMLHCDGAIMKIIPDLLEIGVDILNPIQTVVKDFEDTMALKAKFGDQVCFHGGIDVQQVLTQYKPDQVRQEVKKRISDLGPHGGYIIAPCHNINIDIPLENTLALFSAAQEFGRYPGPW